MPVKENTYALTDLDRVKRHAGITSTDHDAELVDLINETSSRIEGYLGRRLLTRTWTHDGSTLPRLNSYGGQSLCLPNWPVTAVSALKLYPDGSSLTEGYNSDFVVDQDSGIIHLVGQTFWDARQVVEITYTAGYLTSPTAAQGPIWGWDEASAEIQLAAAKQTVWEFHQKDREREGVASRSEAGATVSFLNQEWLPEVMGILERHRRTYL